MSAVATPDLTFIEETHTYIVGGIVRPSVTQVIRSAGIVSAPEGVFLMAAAARGRAVHRACELSDKGTLDESSVDPLIVGHLEQYRRFRSETGFSPVLSEKRFYAAPFGYCGTLDLFGDLFGDPSVVDIKSVMQSAPPMRAVGVQLAGYDMGLPWCGLSPSPGFVSTRPRKRFALTVWPKGYRLTEFKDPRDRRVFLSALDVVRFKDECIYRGEKPWWKSD